MGWSDRSGGRARARNIFSTIIDYSFEAYKVIIFSLKVCRVNIREVREGEVPGHWRGIYVLLVLGFPHSHPIYRNYNHPPTLSTQSLQPMNSLPIGPRTSPPLLMLSQQTFRLKIITSNAERCGYELIISAENNANLGRGLGSVLPSRQADGGMRLRLSDKRRGYQPGQGESKLADYSDVFTCGRHEAGRSKGR